MVNMFNIIKHCESKNNSCNTEYSKNITAGNDPTITRRMRYSQLVNTRKPVAIRNFKPYEGIPVRELPAYLYPKGQIFGLKNFS